MKLSTKQYQIITAVSIIVTLTVLCLHFGLYDLMKASIEDENESLWTIEPVEYPIDEDGEKHVVIKVTFHNTKLFKDFYGTPTECTNFDFTFTPSGNNLDIQQISTTEDIPFGESFEMTYDSVIVPVREIDETSEIMRIRVLCYDENNSIVNTGAGNEIPLSQLKQLPEPEETPGFEAVFAIASILLVMYLIKNKR